jgi:dCMP deaminase|tara:strand:+ start:7630 stop:8127 length:498 start_codon:yes stop_codon:yes gene_type:complete
MKQKLILAHMEVAKTYSMLSTASNAKVGCIIVKDDRIISIGYNGTPSGWENVCEEDSKTKPEVLHAEANAITKLAKSHESGENAYLFTTHAPCLSCAKLIYQSGITTVYYLYEYKYTDGCHFLIKCDIEVTPIHISAWEESEWSIAGKRYYQQYEYTQQKLNIKS